jgi:TRAP-type C4-dicarboxylate transport system permease small subunit
MNDIIGLSLLAISFIGLMIYIISTLRYVMGDGPVIAERLRRYSFVRED